jgi:Protein of unknown function (DUF2817)
LESYAIDVNDTSGPGGEKLAIEVACLGSADPGRIVIVSSGLHGIEGFLGSAIQLAWLEMRVAQHSLASDSAFILIHAINPFGFAWRRRSNERNVDLNRNFLDDRSFLTCDPAYAESRRIYDGLDTFLNPASLPSPCEPYTAKAINVILQAGLSARARMSPHAKPSYFQVREIFALGLAELQKSLPVGQYEHDKGLFYGGRRSEQSTRVLQRQLPVWTANARMILHVDFHTGLGVSGGYKLLVVDEPGSDRYEWLKAQFGSDDVEPSEGRTAYRSRGSMAEYFANRLADRNYHCLTAEFGTYHPLYVLGALRAENRAHFYGNPGQPAYERAKQRLLEAFCPAAPHWRELAVANGLKIIKRAAAVCFGQSLG